nr:DPP IV N-terminal domain-containing protein [Bacteroidales bacterium]
MSKRIKKLYKQVLPFILLLASLTAAGQLTQADYDRADALQTATSGKVFNGAVRPSWIGERSVFLYENTGPEGTEYVIVDPVRAAKREAFDQRRFAEALTAVTGKKAEAGKLPLRNLLFSESLSSFAFIHDGFNWICNLRDYSIVKGDPVNERQRNSSWDWGFRDELAGAPLSSPDKKWSAFVKNWNVYIKSASDGKEYQLSTDGGTGEYYSSYMKWSDDSRKLFAYRVKPAEKHMIYYIESSPDDQLQPKHYSYEYQKPGDAVPQKYPQVFDIDGRKHIKVDDSLIPNQYSINNIAWKSGSNSFTFEYNRRGHQVYQVISIDAETGFSRVLINETSPTFIHYSGKYYRHDLDESREIIWASERDGWNHLWLYDAASGKVKNQITKGEWVVRGVSFVDEKKRVFVFQASGLEPGDPYFFHYYRINLYGTGLVRMTSGNV